MKANKNRYFAFNKAGLVFAYPQKLWNLCCILLTSRISPFKPMLKFTTLKIDKNYINTVIWGGGEGALCVEIRFYADIS